MYDNVKVQYKPISSPDKPFLIDGKWYNRDEAVKVVKDSECSNAVCNHINGQPY